MPLLSAVKEVEEARSCIASILQEHFKSYYNPDDYSLDYLITMLEQKLDNRRDAALEFYAEYAD